MDRVSVLHSHTVRIQSQPLQAQRGYSSSCLSLVSVSKVLVNPFSMKTLSDMGRSQAPRVFLIYLSWLTVLAPLPSER